MVRHLIGLLLVAATAGSPSGVRTQEAAKTLTGHLTVATSPAGRTTVVAGGANAGAEPDFLFCISHAKPLSSKIEYKGPGKVIYQPRQRPEAPPGITITGPTPVAPLLAVAPANAPPMIFTAPGQTIPAEASLDGATTYTVGTVTRMDWAAAKGPRRGTSIEGCLAPGG